MTDEPEKDPNSVYSHPMYDEYKPEDMGMLGGAVWDVLTGEALREYCIAQHERLDELREVLKFILNSDMAAMAEDEGRICPELQAARAALQDKSSGV